jgi:radical SAM protein with 4Fe4S-binding SPASM domain
VPSIIDKSFNPLDHYERALGPVSEFGSLPEAPPTIKNIGWTLGNDCPYRCTHCYSMNAREKGKDLEPWMVDKIVEDLRTEGIETVNLGGNEPLFTNGSNPKNTLLPHIIRRLHDAGIKVGLTTSGITLVYLYKHFPDEARLLNDCDVSFDSPYEHEHNENRGARIFHQAIEALEICRELDIPHTCIMAAMSWNFSENHVAKLVDLARRYDAYIRINPLKPVQPQHLPVTPTPEQYYRGFDQLMRSCTTVELGEPPLAAASNAKDPKRCPCGRTSFRIHSITPTGEVYISPCVYLHDYKVPIDLLKNPLSDIIQSPQFRAFRQRNFSPNQVDGCSGCSLTKSCGGGCAARSYLHKYLNTGERSLKARDPYCPKKHDPGNLPEGNVVRNNRLVHMDYLCTWIGKPV